MGQSLEKKAGSSHDKVAVGTATRYPGWYPGETNNERRDTLIDKTRGDLALDLLVASLEQGYKTLVVDGGSSPAFFSAVSNLGVDIEEEKRPGMSPGRRQLYRKISRIPGVEVIGFVDPEKGYYIKNGFQQTVLPVLQGRADIALPVRNKEAFETLPEYQAMYEQRARRLWNKILMERELLPENSNLDPWFGQRVFKNDPDMVRIFTSRIEFNPDKKRNPWHEIVDPELWPNAQFNPIVLALHEKFRVKGVNIEYKHPPRQTHLEEEPDFINQYKLKRYEQFFNIMFSTIGLINLLQNRKSRFVWSAA